MTATIVVGISYGKEIHNMDDEYIRLVQTALEGVIQTKRPGVFWMDYFPILKHIPAWVPGATGRKLAERYVPVVRAMRDQPFYSAKDDVVSSFTCTEIIIDANVNPRIAQWHSRAFRGTHRDREAAITIIH